MEASTYKSIVILGISSTFDQTASEDLDIKLSDWLAQ